MRLRCPGCKVTLQVEEHLEDRKMLLQCPDCMMVFMSRDAERVAEEDNQVVFEAPEDATLLTTDYAATGDSREFQWNLPGASVTVIEGDNQGVHMKLRKGSMVFGRKGADLEIEDKAVSRKHCEIARRDDGWWVKDLGSTNGTFVNGDKIGEFKLRHLDEIRVGKTRILFAETMAEKDHTLAEREDEERPGGDETKISEDGRESERPLPQGREFYFEFMTGAKKARSYQFERSKVILGRGEEADVLLDDEGVSRKHALVEVYSRDQVYIQDLASHNGTWLNGIKTKNTKLLHGDLIRMGDTVLKFIVKDSP